MTLPPPWHDGQVRSTVKKPDWERILPWPWQVAQVTGGAPPAPPVPLQAPQVTDVGTRMVAFLPRKAS